jgi:predicted HicB family RNase H-like nuclease
MAKQKKSSVNRFLPSKEETNKDIKKIVPTLSNSPQKKNPKAYRKKFTTMVDPALSKRLKMEALQREISVADILEEIIKNHLE